MRRISLLAALALIMGVAAASSAWAQHPKNLEAADPAVASPVPLAPVGNGTVLLGIDPLGNLNDGALGLTYVPTGNEVLNVAYLGEGWGAADAGLGIQGYANEGFGDLNVALVSYIDDGVSAMSVTTVGGILEVTHLFAPSPDTPNLYEIIVTMKNISGGPLTDVRYTRNMDWDVNPTPFVEFVTIQGTAAEPRVLYADNNGFQSPGPLDPRGSLGAVGDFIDFGPSDQGAHFDFGFGALNTGASVSFVIYYGAAGDEAGALAALAAANASVYSLGQTSTDPAGGTPNTFIFAFGDVPLTKDLTSGPDRDGDGAIDVVVPVGVLTPTAYDFTLTWSGDELVWIYDTVPAEWDVTDIEFDGTGLPLPCGGATDFAGTYGMVDIWRGGKLGKKCNSDTSFRWMPNDSPGGVTRFYWTNGWTAGPAGGPPGTVNRIDADGSNPVVLATLDASGGPLYRVTDVEIDQARDALYFTNWFSGGGNSSANEAIYRTDLEGAGQILFSNASSSPTGFASGLHRLAVDPANGDVYFARAVSYANPNEISKVDVTGGGYTQLIGATDGWFYSGVALDNVNGDVYFGDGGVLLTGAINGALNSMTKAGAAPTLLVPNGFGNGMGKTVAFDPDFGAQGTAFYSGWDICDIFLGPGCGGGDIFAYDVATGMSALIYSSPDSGTPDIEVDPTMQRIYWTDYVNGAILSANYDGSDVVVEIAGLENPFGLALEIEEVDNTLNVQMLARCHDNKKNKKCRPTSCGALYLNYGATAYDKVTGEIVGGPTNPLCLAAVKDVNGDGMYTWDGSGDEDEDGLSDYFEACEGPTYVCDPDSDNDGVLDGADECPLEGPADPRLGEILDPNGCIRQSQCSDGVDNNGDGLIDFPDDPSCDDILDDFEGCVPSTCSAGYPQCDPIGPDGCYCFATDRAITTGACVDNFLCSGAEDCAADPSICEPFGKTCYYDTCCGPAYCGPAMCTGEIQMAPMTLDPAAPTAAGM